MKYLKLIKKLSVFSLLLIVCISCSSRENNDDEDMSDDSRNLIIEGRYSGSFKLTLSGNPITVPVTLTVNEDTTTRFSGNFFETGRFTPCCSTNPQDGTFTFNFNPIDMTIENFVIRVDFNIDPNVPCTDVYRGSGNVEFDERITIESEMLLNDCNVTDTIATLTLTKIGEL